MRREDENRSRTILIRLKPKEFDLLDKGLKRTRLRNMSEYTRNVLLNKPITFIYRNKSMDDILEELILIRKELNLVGINFNQVVWKLNSVSDTPDAKLWEATLTVLRDEFQPLIIHIKDRLNDFSDIWSQSLQTKK